MPRWEEPSHATDLRPNTIWWANGGRSEVVLVQRVDFDREGRVAERVRFQFLNDRRFKRVVSVETFLEEWIIRPRVDLKWLNTGSLWREVNLKEGSLGREKITLNMVRNGRVDAFRGTPKNYSSVFGTFGGAESRVYHFTERYVRVWPTPFPETPDIPVPTKRKPKPEAVRDTVWERLDKDLFDDSPS